MVLRCWLYSILLHGALVPGAGGRVPGVLKSVLAVVGIHVPMISAALCCRGYTPSAMLRKYCINRFRLLIITWKGVVDHDNQSKSVDTTILGTLLTSHCVWIRDSWV